MEKIEGAMMCRVPDIIVPLHINPEIEIVHVRQGVLHVTYDGISFDMEVGQLLLILPYRLHSFTPSENIEASVYMFSDEIYDDMLPMIGSGVYSPVQDNPVLNDYVAYIMEHDDCWKGNFGIQSLFAALVNQCLSAYSAELPSTEPELLDGRTVGYILEHLCEELTIEKIAKDLGVSPRQLSTNFKKKFGVKLLEFIGNIRVEQAATMLRFSTASITEIASECGFGSLRNFNRLFRQRFHMSPREFKQQKDRHA